METPLIAGFSRCGYGGVSVMHRGFPCPTTAQPVPYSVNRVLKRHSVNSPLGENWVTVLGSGDANACFIDFL